MKEDQRKEAKMTELINQFESHPLTQKIKADWAVETLTRRREAARKIEALRKDQSEIIPKLEEAVKDKEAKYLEAKAALDAAGGEFQKARAMLSSERNSFDTDIRNQESFLYETSDPLIEEAILWFRDRHEALLRKSPDKQTRRGKINVFSMTKELTTFSNVAAIQNALGNCMAAIRELEGMKLIPALDLDRITELKRGIPDTGEMTEVVREKPLGRINIDPRSLLPSDDEMSWTLAKLNKKFQKVMGRI